MLRTPPSPATHVRAETSHEHKLGTRFDTTYFMPTLRPASSLAPCDLVPQFITMIMLDRGGLGPNLPWTP